MKKIRTYLDARLWLFILLAIGASVISSHGAYTFFLYLVDPLLAAVFIGVVALGIIGLDAAGTLERGWRRVPYFGGMAVFLTLETLANYFSGQSDFVARIVAKLPPSSDLRAIAEGSPGTTRALVVLFLSMASIAVALFTFAAAARFAHLRAAGATRRRWLGRKIRMRRSAAAGALRAARARLADIRATSAQQVAELATVRAQSAQALADVRSALDLERAQSARAAERVRIFVRHVRARWSAVLAERRALRSEVAALRSQSAAQADELGELRSAAERAAAAAEDAGTEARQVRATSAQQVAEIERLRTAAAELRSASAAAEQRAQQAERLAEHRLAELEDLRRAGGLDPKALAQRLRDRGVSARAIADAMAVSDKTIRNWTIEIKEAA